MRGQILDQYGRAMYVGDMVETVDLTKTVGLSNSAFKIIAEGDIANIFGANVRDITDGSIDEVGIEADGWGYDTWSGMPHTIITFTLFLDANGNDLPDAGELQSNKLVTTFVYGP